ncbi:sugar phosphate isomerase/epimerase family protein [Natrinema salinisoli]|uniref:sugar phosphate isomerase/epimerase family protein n=1 Tax=Natrinema salinisoli TaxID=2878535 RepID=UPI001CF0464C|nr:TIM barrel protein [Natrinema salinisoli]
MDRRIQFSVPLHPLREHASKPRSTPSEFLSAISEVDADIELYDPDPYARHIIEVKQTLEEFGLEIKTVHGGHLQRLLDNGDKGSELITQVRHLHLASVIDQTPTHSLEPEVSAHHAPRLWADSNVDGDEVVQEFLTEFDRALDHLEPDPTRANLDDAVFDGSCITATVCLEKVAPRGPHEYLLVTPENVDTLQQIARERGCEDAVSFTCDVGHSRQPIELLHTMNDVRNIHLHSTAPLGSATTDRLHERYDLPPDVQTGREDRDGIAHHLPPHVGDLELPRIFDALDDIDYDGPITIELDEPYRTAEIVQETMAAIGTYR